MSDRPTAGTAPATALANVNLFVRDAIRAGAFYREALGLRDDPRSAPPDFVLLDAGSCTLTIQTAAALGETIDAISSVELGFEVRGPEALDAARARIAAAGGTADSVTEMGWARAFDARDLDGHRLTVFVRKAEGRPPSA